jgi:hypothetical protein
MREVEREGGHHCSVVYMWVHFDYALRTLLYYLVHNYTANHSFLVQIMHMLNAHLIGCSFSPNSYVYSGFVYDRSTSPCSTGFYLHIFILYFCTSWKREGKIQFCLFCSSGGPLDRCWKGRMAHAYGTVVMMDGGKVVVVTRRA